MKRRLLIGIFLLAGASRVFGLFGMGDTVVVVGDPLRDAQWAKELAHVAKQVNHWKTQIQKAQATLNDTNHMVKFMGDLGTAFESINSIRRDIDSMGDTIGDFRFPDKIEMDYRIDAHGTPPTSGFAVEAGQYREVIGRDIIIEGEIFEERNEEDFEFTDLRMEAYDNYAARVAKIREAMDEEAERQGRIYTAMSGGDEMTEAKLMAMQASLDMSANRMEQYKAALDSAKAEYEGTLSDIETERERREIAARQEADALTQYQTQKYNESLRGNRQRTVNTNNERVEVDMNWWEGLKGKPRADAGN